MRFWLLFTFAIILVASVEFVIGGCREQERNTCEIMCQMNTKTKRTECNLRAIVILPKMDKVEASLPRVIDEYYDFYFFFGSLIFIPNFEKKNCSNGITCTVERSINLTFIDLSVFLYTS